MSVRLVALLALAALAVAGGLWAPATAQSPTPGPRRGYGPELRRTQLPTASPQARVHARPRRTPSAATRGRGTTTRGRNRAYGVNPYQPQLIIGPATVDRLLATPAPTAPAPRRSRRPVAGPTPQVFEHYDTRP